MCFERANTQFKKMALALEFYLQIDSEYFLDLSTQDIIIIVEILQWMYST